MNIKRNLALLGAIFALSTQPVSAGGLEIDAWYPTILYEKGTYAEFAWYGVNPDVTGLIGGSLPISNINPYYDQYSFAFKTDLSKQVAISLSSYQPLGYHVQFPVVAPIITSPFAGQVDSRAYALVAKYKASENFSFYGGINYVTIKARAENLPGLAGTGFQFSSDADLGYILGAAYSIPEIALRVSFTYESGTAHSFPTSVGPIGGPFASGILPDSTGGTPEAFVLDFETGIATDTVVFGRVRHAVLSGSDLFLTGTTNVSNFADEQTYFLGIGRTINETVSAWVGGVYENGSGRSSDFNPTDGRFTAATGFKYKMSENMELSPYGSYTWGGDSVTATGSIPFDDNSSIAYGIKVGFRF